MSERTRIESLLLRALQYTAAEDADDPLALQLPIPLFSCPRDAVRTVPADVGELEERVGVRFEVELLGDEDVRHGNVLDWVNAERPKDAALRIDFLDVPGAPTRQPKAPLTDGDVEVVSMIQLSELLRGEDRPKKCLGSRFGRLALRLVLLRPRDVPLVGPVAPLPVGTGLTERVEPLVRSMPAPAALVLVEVLVAHRVFERDADLLLELAWQCLARLRLGILRVLGDQPSLVLGDGWFFEELGEIPHGHMLRYTDEAAMRFKNFSTEALKIPFQSWVKRSEEQPGKLEGRLDMSILFDPGEVSDELEPDDPIAQLLLKAHPELRPYTLPTLWERIPLIDL